MNDKIYRIILPYKLENISKYGDLYDVVMCNNKNAKILIISIEDFEKMNFENMCLDLYVKYGFLLGEGDYYFLNSNECKLLKEYLTNKETCTQISQEIHNSLIDLCNEAIELNTGLGFDF